MAINLTSEHGLGGGLKAPALTGAAKHAVVRAIVGKITPTKPTAPPPLTPYEQAQQMINNELTPLESQITGAYTKQASAGGAAIKNLTDAYAASLAQEPDAFKQIYGPAEQSTAAADSALSDRLTGMGSNSADELASRLASIQEPGATDPVVSGLRSAATGSGTAVYGAGNASLEQLLGEGADAQTYAAKLPGVAKETGIQSLAQFQAALGGNESKDLTALTDKIPGLVNTAASSIQSSQDKQAATAAANTRATNSDKISQERVDSTNRTNAVNFVLKSGIDPATGELTPNAQALLSKVTGAPAGTFSGMSASTAASVAHDKVIESQGTAKVTQGQERVTIAQQNANTAAARAATVATKATAAAAAKGKPTADEISKLVDSWKNGKVISVRKPAPNPDSNGNPVSTTTSAQADQLTFQQAYKRLIAMKVGDQKARQYLDSAYQRGEQGRAWLTNEEQDALARSGQPSKATVMQGRGVLKSAQVQALKAAKKLPPGQATAEGLYVIAPGY